MPDAERVQGVDAGRIVRDYGARVYGLALRLAGNAADAEDLAQETLLQVVRRGATIRSDDDAAVFSWLARTAGRLYRRKFLKRRAGRPAPMPGAAKVTPFSDRVVAELTDPRGRTPLDRLVAVEARSAMERAIAGMPAAFRVPLVLKDIAELPIADVAEILGVRAETVKTRVHRARLLVRKTMLARTGTRPAPAPVYERRVCADLLRAKLEAMDRGRGAALGREVVCERCRLVFRELDATQAVCAAMAEASPPRAVLERMRAALERSERPGGPGAGSGGNSGNLGRRRGL
jgi:RNA polymerase sigma-70 factor, ECF subfamily